MSDASDILSNWEKGADGRAEELLPLVYDELRKLAADRLARESPGQTLQATALVHEAYLRLVGNASPECWDSRGHFFAAAAEAMRRILVDSARSKMREKRGGARCSRINLDESELISPEPREDLLALDAALDKLAACDGPAAEMVKLRYFSGLTIPESARILQMSPRSADRLWAYARAWLYNELYGSHDPG